MAAWRCYASRRVTPGVTVCGSPSHDDKKQVARSWFPMSAAFRAAVEEFPGQETVDRGCQRPSGRIVAKS